MATPHSKVNQTFTDAAHRAAQRLLYPALFTVEPDRLSFEDSKVGQDDVSTFLDGEMAIDRTVKVRVPELRLPLLFTVQERFRRPRYASFRDLTITEWNPRSNLPSELYKLRAQFFVYGYYDEANDCFIEAVAVDVAALLMMIVRDSIPYKFGDAPNPRTDQPFVCFKFDDLLTSHAACHWWALRQGVFNSISPKIGPFRISERAA